MWDVVRIVAGEPGTALAVRPLLPQWDPEAAAVAVGVRCAAGEGQGWTFLAAVAERPRPPAGDELPALAASLGIDAGRFAACSADPATAAAVAKESAEAERVGLEDPPAVLVDGRPFTGLQKANRLRAVARAARRRPRS
jgi:protein-disulfide isomerase